MQPTTPKPRQRRKSTIASLTSTDPLCMTKEQLALRQLVIDTADMAFRHKGIKKVTMDEVSKNLRMSKRTLYQFFRDKEELVMACVKSNMDNEHKFAEQIAARASNVLEIMLGVTAYRINDFSSASDNYLREIQLFPNVAQYFKQRRSQVDEEFIHLLQIGVDQGLFRSDINYAVVVHALALLTDNVLHRAESLEHYTIEEFIKNFVVVLFRGCVTDKGREVIDNFKAPLPKTKEENHPNEATLPNGVVF